MTTYPPHVRLTVAEAVQSVLALAGDADTALTYASLLADVAYQAGTDALTVRETAEAGAAVRRIRDGVADTVRRLAATDADKAESVLAALARAEV